jgi:glutaredoxin 3
MQAEIWTKDPCPYCVKAKKILNDLNIPYTEYKISAGMGESQPAPNQFYVTRDQLLEKMPTARTVPQIWIDGRHVGGCDNLEAEVKAGKISANISL